MIQTTRPPTRSRAFAALDVRASARLLFTPRRPGGRASRLALIDSLVFVLYAAIVAFAIHHHLASDDEAQAWLLARDNSLHDLLLRRMHYEGAPGLWVSMLWVAIRLHLPFAAINWIGEGFACVGVLLLLFRSPFPPFIRWLLPFTFFFAYQYAVIARPYTLFPGLLFLLCLLYHQARPRPILFAVVAGLLVNISLHAAVISGVMALMYMERLRHVDRPGRAQLEVQSLRARLACATAIFLVFAVASIAVAFPAPDVVIAGVFPSAVERPGSIRARFIPPEKLPPGVPALDAQLNLVSVGARQSATGDEEVAPPPRLLMIAARTILLGPNAACFPIARSNLLNVSLLLSLCFWLRQRRALKFLLPWLAALVISSQVLIFDHHTGQFAMALVAACWLALEAQSSFQAAPGSQRGDLAVVLVFVLVFTSSLVILLQIGWTFHAVRYERSHPDDPGKATADFLRANYSGKRIAGFSYESVSTEANSPTKLFLNQPAAYWIWSAPIYVDLRRTEARRQHPDVVVLADLTKDDESPNNQWGHLWKKGERPFEPALEDWLQHGYHIDRRFCGQRPMRLGFASTLCEVILEPDPEPGLVAARSQ